MSVDFPMSQATQELTGFETIALESKFGKRLDAMGLGELTVGMVWVFEKRTNPDILYTEVGKRSQRELASFFATEDPALDEDDDPKE